SIWRGRTRSKTTGSLPGQTSTFGEQAALNTRHFGARTSQLMHAVIKATSTGGLPGNAGEKSMEPTTQADPGKTALEAQIRECFGRVVYSTKTHEKCADLCMGRLQRIKIAQIVLSAITTGGLLTAVLGDPKVAQVAMIVSTLFSTVLLVLTAY